MGRSRVGPRFRGVTQGKAGGLIVAELLEAGPENRSTSVSTIQPGACGPGVRQGLLGSMRARHGSDPIAAWRLLLESGLGQRARRGACRTSRREEVGTAAK